MKVSDEQPGIDETSVCSTSTSAAMLGYSEDETNKQVNHL